MTGMSVSSEVLASLEMFFVISPKSSSISVNLAVLFSANFFYLLAKAFIWDLSTMESYGAAKAFLLLDAVRGVFLASDSLLSGLDSCFSPKLSSGCFVSDTILTRFEDCFKIGRVFGSSTLL